MADPGNRFLQALQRSCTASSALDFETVLRETAAAVASVPPPLFCVIRVADSKAGGYRMVGSADAMVKACPALIPFGSGLTGVVAETRNKLLVPDLRADLRAVGWLDRLSSIGQVAYAGLPLLAGEELLGILEMFTPGDAPLTPEEQETMELLSRHVALSLQNARLHAEVTRRRHEGEELARVARTLTESLDVTEVGQRIVETVLPLFQARASTLRRLQPDGSLVMVAVAGDLRGVLPVGHVTPPGYGLGGRAIALGHPVQTLHLLQEPGIPLTDEPRRFFAESGDRAILALPLRAKAGTIGVLAVLDQAGRVFSNAEIGLAQAFADQAAIALENARLYTNLQREDSDRRRAEQALRESEERFRSLYEDNPSMYFTIAPDGTVLSVNHFGAEQLGYRAEELVGETVLKVFHPEDREPVTQQVARCLAEPTQVHHWQLRKIRKDGSLLWVEEAARAARDERGNPVVLIVCEDVTDRVRLEERLRQAQKMEGIGRLAGGVAHDFNNLLTAILGQADLLRSSLAPPDPRGAHVEEIRRTAERAAWLTRQLLAFSRRQVLQPRVLDLNAIVVSAGTLLRRLIGEDIELVSHLDPSLSPIRADPGQLEQVIMNLAVNARDAMPGGGRITLTTRNVTLEGTEAAQLALGGPGDYVLLTVTDSGVGMDEDTRARIFEPFFTTKEGKGTGLGLATVYGIIKQSGGSIWADSEPGRGTTFRIYLPRTDGTVDAAPAPRTAIPLSPGQETVLLVEDEEAVRAVARESLTRHGYTVLEAGNGEAALRLAAQHRGVIQLLLTDVVMPGMGGRELAERLARERPELRVIYMSGYTDDVVLRRGMLDPRLDHLEKPFTPDTLATKVREVLDRH